MGTYTELTVANYPLVSSKSSVVPEMMTVFRETDRRVFIRNASERNPLVWGKFQGDDEEETVIEYSCKITHAIDRLNVMGFNAARVRAEFEQGREYELRECEADADEDFWREKRELLAILTFEKYADGLAHVLRNGAPHRLRTETRRASIRSSNTFLTMTTSASSVTWAVTTVCCCASLATSSRQRRGSSKTSPGL